MSDERTARVFSVHALPPREREQAAEEHLRRPGVPGPAAEHAMQHIIGTWSEPGRDGRSRSDVIAKGADNFYAKQYRQFLSPKMGAFAGTATHALIGAGTLPVEPSGEREVRSAMVVGRPHLPPILVIDHQTVAIVTTIPRRLVGGNAISEIAGRPVTAAGPGTRASERSRYGSMLEVIEAALTSSRLAILALHPTDLDAMGLHITLFGVERLDAAGLVADHGLDPALMAPMVATAEADDDELVFLVGGTEEIFTQCSQNIFVKRRPREGEVVATSVWSPDDPMRQLVNAQFELFQVTVSASGLPGVSPRNGDLGGVAYMVPRGEHESLLIPYHPGNFIHGHAAKLWSNPRGAIVIYDDHTYRRSVTLRGPARVLSPEQARREFPLTVAEEVKRVCDVGGRRREPEYWFEQVVLDILIEADELGSMVLDDARPTCTISAAGQSAHGKKPAYFDAEVVNPYDQQLQHHREAQGRPKDPSGLHHARWVAASAEQIRLRTAHLASIVE